MAAERARRGGPEFALDEADGLSSSELERLGGLAFLLCGDVAEAEDAAGEAVARVLGRQHGAEIAEVGPYLRRTLVNVVARTRRRRRSEQQALDRSFGRPGGPRVDDVAIARSDVARALGSLPFDQRAVVVLRYYDDLSEKEVAGVLGVPVGTVKSRTARALEALRPLLARGAHDA